MPVARADPRHWKTLICKGYRPARRKLEGIDARPPGRRADGGRHPDCKDTRSQALCYACAPIMTAPPTFRQFLVQLAERIGRHQLPLHDGASEIRDFLGPEGVHHELVSRLVRQVYRGSRCGHLDAPLDPAATLDLLAETAAATRRSARADIDQVRLADELLAAAVELLGGAPAPRPARAEAAPEILPFRPRWAG